MPINITDLDFLDLLLLQITAEQFLFHDDTPQLIIALLGSVAISILHVEYLGSGRLCRWLRVSDQLTLIIDLRGTEAQLGSDVGHGLSVVNLSGCSPSDWSIIGRVRNRLHLGTLARLHHPSVLRRSLIRWLGISIRVC
jgi:hypothetical protein